MKNNTLFILILVLLFTVPANAHTPVNKQSNEPHTDLSFGLTMVIPRGVMKDDVRSMGVWELAVARQINSTPLHVGFHMGLGSYGSFNTEIPYFDDGQWIDRQFKVYDNLRTFFISLRYEFLRDTKLVPYAQAKFGNFRMSTRSNVVDEETDPACPHVVESQLMHADNTWIYGSSLGLRFQPFFSASEGRESFTIDFFVGMMRGNQISYTAHNAPHGGAVVDTLVQMDDDVFIEREADWIQSSYHGTYLYRSLLNSIEAGLRVGVRF